MRDMWQALRLLVATAWREDPKLTLGTALEPMGRASQVLVGLWLALITTGVVEQRAVLVMVGVAGLVLGAGAAEVLGVFGTNWRLKLSEKVGLAFDAEIARVSAGLSGLEHHERSDYFDRLELLRQRHGALGRSMNGLINAANALVAGVVVVVLLTVVHPLLLLTILLALPSMWVSRQQQRWHRRAEEESALPGRLTRHLRRLAYDRNAGMEVRVFGLQSQIAGRVHDSWADYRRPVRRAERRALLLGGVREVVFLAGVVAAIGYVLWRAFNGQASAGDVVLAAYVATQVQTAVIWPIQQVASLGQTLRAAGRLLWLRDYAGSVRAGGDASVSGPAGLTEGIVLENVSFGYPGSDRPVLDNVSLTIPAGSVLAVVGENGAGKTTLVKLLAGMYQPTSGRILIDGVPLADIDVQSWRSRLSAAFQDFARFEFTAGHVVGVGDLPRRDDSAAALAALERAGASDVTAALPDGLDSQLGVSWDDGVDLSTGQWQKLALGRALMREDPLLVFFDEPTASLDATTEHALFEKYAQAARAGRDRGMITILISHRFSTVSTADRILVLDAHTVAEHGTHDELLALGGLYAELYTLQQQAYHS